MSALPASFLTSTARPFVNPDDQEDTEAMILALVARSGSLFDGMADRLADDLAKYRARCDAALARTQEPTPC